jgi:hypothetical protein
MNGSAQPKMDSPRALDALATLLYGWLPIAAAGSWHRLIERGNSPLHLLPTARAVPTGLR